jgi:hypothetical protein
LIDCIHDSSHGCGSAKLEELAPADLFVFHGDVASASGLTALGLDIAQYPGGCHPAARNAVLTTIEITLLTRSAVLVSRRRAVRLAIRFS